MRIQLVDATNAVIEIPAGTYDISLWNSMAIKLIDQLFFLAL